MRCTNLNFQKPSVIIAIPDEHLNNDEFVTIAYNKIFEVKEIYTKLFNKHLDIAFVSSDNLDDKLLQEDGFGYKESYK